MSHKKRIRIFHPRKLWFSLAAVALTVGMAVGEARYADPSNQILTPLKLSRTMQVSMFDFMGSTKLGARRLPYLVSKLSSSDFNPLEQDELSKSGVKSVCFEQDELVEGESPLYTASVSEVKVSDSITGGDAFRVEVYVANTGNVIWFGMNSECEGKTVVNLGTDKTRDRASVFFYEGDDTGWIGNNRVQLIEDAVRPGETGTFAFTTVAPETTTIYREYFDLVAENVTWFEDVEVAVDVRIGDVTEDDETKLAFLREVSMDTASLTGERAVRVDLSAQQLSLVVNGVSLYTMPISSGASDTPTPKGTYKIMSKQELRVGGASPHYRMPYFQMFTKYGHGLHALPYLGSTTGGWFWQEALTHIGVPVSHGCIRLLPEDAVLMYQFTDIGTVLEIEA